MPPVLPPSPGLCHLLDHPQQTGPPVSPTCATRLSYVCYPPLQAGSSLVIINLPDPPVLSKEQAEGAAPKQLAKLQLEQVGLGVGVVVGVGVGVGVGTQAACYTAARAGDCVSK